MIAAEATANSERWLETMQRQVALLRVACSCRFGYALSAGIVRLWRCTGNGALLK